MYLETSLWHYDDNDNDDDDDDDDDDDNATSNILLREINENIFDAF